MFLLSFSLKRCTTYLYAAIPQPTCCCILVVFIYVGGSEHTHVRGETMDGGCIVLDKKLQASENTQATF